MTGKSNLDLMNYIGGEFVPHSTKEWLDVVEPATGVCYARVPLSNTEDIDAAVKAANLAKREWGSLSLEESGHRKANCHSTLSRCKKVNC
jgi:aminomuconate-semialdehyde/2-hydroxymuconate-6-semialdehyde dehydrogenase